MLSSSRPELLLLFIILSEATKRGNAPSRYDLFPWRRRTRVTNTLSRRGRGETTDRYKFLQGAVSPTTVGRCLSHVIVLAGPQRFGPSPGQLTARVTVELQRRMLLVACPTDDLLSAETSSANKPIGLPSWLVGLYGQTDRWQQIRAHIRTSL